MAEEGELRLLLLMLDHHLAHRQPDELSVDAVRVHREAESLEELRREQALGAHIEDQGTKGEVEEPQTTQLNHTCLEYIENFICRQCALGSHCER
jgi:hypothetical protein